jgi:hypothetical protein
MKVKRYYNLLIHLNSSNSAGDYCLYFASTNKWVINTCPQLGSTSSYMRTAATNKQCVHADGLLWEYNSGIEDPTMSAECSVSKFLKYLYSTMIFKIP